jgi:hypothetical protein
VATNVQRYSEGSTSPQHPSTSTRRARSRTDNFRQKYLVNGLGAAKRKVEVLRFDLERQPDCADASVAADHRAEVADERIEACGRLHLGHKRGDIGTIGM